MSYTKLELDFELDEDENSIHIKIQGFDSFEEAEKYCEFLHKYARLIFFNSEVAQ
jgi:hypothetical protein